MLVRDVGECGDNVGAAATAGASERCLFCVCLCRASDTFGIKRRQAALARIGLVHVEDAAAVERLAAAIGWKAGSRATVGVDAVGRCAHAAHLDGPDASLATPSRRPLFATAEGARD